MYYLEYTLCFIVRSGPHKNFNKQVPTMSELIVSVRYSEILYVLMVIPTDFLLIYLGKLLFGQLSDRTGLC